LILLRLKDTLVAVQRKFTIPSLQFSIASFPSARLLQWFRRHKRDLPWRRTHDPYRIWVSEIMLQQTQVNTVIPYYERWLQQFPDVQTLAAAPSRRVLKAWEGLGYYSRARNIHAAAKLIIKKHNGQFPREFAEVLALPGIGRYTAGAICSIAFDIQAPVLDGNVVRVVSRYFGVRENARAPRIQKQLWALAESLLPQRNVGEFNESLMELGALVCVPHNPRCKVCPLRGSCIARRQNMQDRLPNLGKRAASKPITRIAALTRKGDFLLLFRDRRSRLLGDMWRLPFVEINPSEPTRNIERRFATTLSLSLRLRRPLVTVRHSITTSRITLTAWEASIANGFSLPSQRSHLQWKWCDPPVLRRLALDAATKRVLEQAQWLAPGRMIKP
jgi:A/G-specific adenine glycosylase